MTHPRRMFEHGACYFITNRLAFGLPLIPCNFISSIILGTLAKASNKYPNIKICTVDFMQNHYHMIIVSDGEPSDISGFIGLFQGELAKAICRLLGVCNVKVWAQRFNAARLLTADKVIEKIVYSYLNPIAANMVDKLEDWPGVNCYKFLKELSKKLDIDKETSFSISCKYILPKKLFKLANRDLNSKDHCFLENFHGETKGFECSLEIKPLCWMKCFKSMTDRSEGLIVRQIVEMVEKEEEAKRRRRVLRKERVIGVKRVMSQNPHKAYKPKEFGRRVFCISSCIELRKKFVEVYKDFCVKCEEAWDLWKRSRIPVEYPPGAFLPSLYPIVNIIPFET